MTPELVAICRTTGRIETFHDPVAKVREQAMALSERVPRVAAMLLCRQAIQDAQSSLITLVSIVEDLTTRRLPLVVPALSMFARLVDAQGEYIFTVEVVRRDDELALAAFDLPRVTIPDPLNYVQLVAGISGFEVERAGSYDVRLWMQGQRFVGLTSLRVLSV